MNWALVITQIAPILVQLLSNTSEALFKNRPTDTHISTPQANDAVKALQELLNKVLGLNPPLEVDGWLGPKTDAAIFEAIARLKTFGIG